jgi:hypothetical protein
LSLAIRAIALPFSFLEEPTRHQHIWGHLTDSFRHSTAPNRVSPSKA